MCYHAIALSTLARKCLGLPTTASVVVRSLASAHAKVLALAPLSPEYRLGNARNRSGLSQTLDRVQALVRACEAHNVRLHGSYHRSAEKHCQDTPRIFLIEFFYIR
jgi:hypothetical protein